MIKGNPPVVSVIVPCYNQANYLGEALGSVLAQSFESWECIVVNDGSIDDTEVVAEKFAQTDHRITYLYRENSGLCNARNAGIQIARGEYILPLDADDYIAEDYLKKAIEVFVENKRTALVYCLAHKFGAENYPWEMPEFNYDLLLKGNMIFCSAIFRKTDFINAGMYDPAMIGGFEDWELWIRLLSDNAIVTRLPATYFFYRVKESSMNRMPSKKVEELKYRIFLKHIEKYRSRFLSPISLLEEIDLLKTIYKNSPDYKLGNALIAPLRKLYFTLKRYKK